MLNRRSDPSTGSPKTASPAESGPRSPMQVSIGTTCSPSDRHSSGFLAKYPTMPHMNDSRDATVIEGRQSKSMLICFPINAVLCGSLLCPDSSARSR